MKIQLWDYHTGGWSVSAGDCGLRKLRNLIVSGTAMSYPLLWDQVNGKLLCYKSVGVEMDDHSTLVENVRIMALAIGH